MDTKINSQEKHNSTNTSELYENDILELSLSDDESDKEDLSNINIAGQNTILNDLESAQATNNSSAEKKSNTKSKDLIDSIKKIESYVVEDKLSNNNPLNSSFLKDIIKSDFEIENVDILSMMKTKDLIDSDSADTTLIYKSSRRITRTIIDSDSDMEINNSLRKTTMALIVSDPDDIINKNSDLQCKVTKKFTKKRNKAKILVDSSSDDDNDDEKKDETKIKELEFGENNKVLLIYFKL